MPVKKRKLRDGLMESIEDKKIQAIRRNTENKKKIKVESRKINKPGSGEGELLKAFGQRIRPLSSEYIGSVSVSMYTTGLVGKGLFKIVTTDLNAIPESFIQAALSDLTKTIIHKYNHKVPVKRGEKFLNESESDKELI